MTRPERVVMWGVAILALTFLGTSSYGLLRWKISRMMTADFRAMEIALFQYSKQQNRLPIAGRTFGDKEYGGPQDTPNRELLNVFLGKTGPGNPDGSLNPGKKPYIGVREAGFLRSGLNPDGEFLDPWGKPYRIVIDADNDNTCDLPGTIYRSAVNSRIAVWSLGWDGRPNTRDDVLSFAR